MVIFNSSAISLPEGSRCDQHWLGDGIFNCQSVESGMSLPQHVPLLPRVTAGVKIGCSSKWVEMINSMQRSTFMISAARLWFPLLLNLPLQLHRSKLSKLKVYLVYLNPDVLLFKSPVCFWWSDAPFRHRINYIMTIQWPFNDHSMTILPHCLLFTQSFPVNTRCFPYRIASARSRCRSPRNPARDVQCWGIPFHVGITPGTVSCGTTSQPCGNTLGGYPLVN